MKKNNLSVPLLVTASLASVIALNLSCGSRHQTDAPADDSSTAGKNTNATPAANSNAVAATATSNVQAVVETTSPATPAPAAQITNPPAAATTSPATPEPAPTAPAASSAVKVVEMPATVPTAPKNFYSHEFTTNGCSGPDYYFALRAGYEHSGLGDNSDTWYAGIKFYAHPNKLRKQLGKNAWLIPDADAELAHHFLAKPDGTAIPGTDEGLSLRASFYWSWVNWTTKVLARENCACPFAQPLRFALGPVFTTGFDKTFDGSGFRFARYGGARLSVNRYAFVQYTFGRTDGFSEHSQEFLAEIPFYVSRDGQVRYVIRGEWQHGSGGTPDYYQIGAFAEMPIGLLLHPRDWHLK